MAFILIHGSVNTQELLQHTIWSMIWDAAA